MYFLRLQTRMLWLLGFDLDSAESLAYNIFCYVNFLISFGIVIAEIVYIIGISSTVELATESLCTFLFGFISLIKMLTLDIQKHQFKRTISDLRYMWSNATDEERSTHLCPINQTTHRIYLFNLVSTTMVGVSYLVIPIINSSYELHVYGNTTWIMPINSVFFYDIDVSPMYELTYFGFVHTTFFVAIGATSIDSLFYASIFNISGHFCIVQDRIGRLTYESNDGHLTRNFTKLCQYHQKLFQLCENLTVCYQPILFWQFVISSLHLCVVAYQLTLPTQDITGYIRYATFTFAIFLQCFLYCNGGNKLEIQSEAVADAIYESNWYQTSNSTKKSIMICLFRSQKPVVVRAKFFVANRPTLKSIISGAGSYITILQTLTGSNN